MPSLERGGEVLRAVVDQQVDLQLGAARDLVVGAVQVVERQPDLLQPRGGGVLAVARPVAGDVHEVALLVPAAHRLHRARVGRAGEDPLVGVALLDAELELVGAQTGDAPRELLVVGQLDAEASHRDLREHVPVVVERRVDVDRNPHRNAGPRVD